MPLRLAILGRPNVGKSTLFNRLVGRRLALVDDLPGVTRDRRSAPASLAGLALEVIDTAGFEEAEAGSLEARMRAQTEMALAECDVALFLTDGRAGLVPLDYVFVEVLRRSGKPVILGVNKAEGRAGEESVLEAFSLGLGEPIGMSAEHGEGMAELYSAIREAIGEEAFAEAVAEGETGLDADDRMAAEILDRLEGIDLDDPDLTDEELARQLAEAGIDTDDDGLDDDDDDDFGDDFDDEDVTDDNPDAETSRNAENCVTPPAKPTRKTGPEPVEDASKPAQKPAPSSASKPALPPRPIRLAVVGRPNAGKSTLINTLLQSDRLLTGPEAGITRDSIEIDWEYEGRKVRLVDTAGLRRKSRIHQKLEQLSVGDTIRSLKFADIVALVMDADEAFEKQDLQIADLALREGRGLVFVVSKWDAVANPDERAKELRQLQKDSLPAAAGAPLIYLSGLTGRRVDRLMPSVIKTYDDWNAKVKTGDLNRWLRAVVERHPPPALHGQRIKPRYMAQIKARPPTFVLIASRGEDMPEAYKRYLINGIREAFDLTGVPIRLHVRQGKNPFAHKARRRT
jgi:GTP-binding protein